MLWLILLWAVPVVAFFLARRLIPAWLWRVTGFAFGAVVSPASMGLYGLYFIGPAVAILGMLGLVLNLVHGGVGYDLALRFGLVNAGTSVSGIQDVYIGLLNGAVWSVVYALAGSVIDWRRGRRARRLVAAA